jgi:hypothetical protein
MINIIIWIRDTVCYIHTAYTTLKMPGPKGVITIMGDQHDALACENTTLMHAGRFSEKAVQDQAAKIAKTPIKRIDLEVSFGIGDNKCREVLTFEVANFDIGYNCILGRPFLLKFMMVIHTSYATLKMPGSKGVITIKADQRDALAR